MTTYNYMIEMQEMCFKIAQACKAMGKTGTQDVYTACEYGFGEMAKQLTCEEASSNINQDQIDTYVCTQNFCAQQEREAAIYIRNQLKELPDETQPAEDLIYEAMHNKAFLEGISESRNI